ncbi:MAG TPA: hypothetical protein VGF86_09820 [Candidatus Tumulicola sp.]
MQTRDRQRRVLLGAIVISAVVHVAVLSLLLGALRTVMTPRGATERVSETTTIELQPRAPAPRPQTRARRKVVRPVPMSMPARSVPRHELAKQVAFAPPQPPRRPQSVLGAHLANDRARFSEEVAQLNKGNDPHAIPTIDPSTAESPSKSYAFNAHSPQGDEHGNGIISPIRSWQDRGRDCYYARYEYTYPSGAMEDGNIVWPVCFDPGSDPFHQPPHQMPFPLPAAGYILPPGTELPPLEKIVYEEWARNISSP